MHAYSQKLVLLASSGGTNFGNLEGYFKNPLPSRNSGWILMLLIRIVFSQSIPTERFKVMPNLVVQKVI